MAYSQCRSLEKEFGAQVLLVEWLIKCMRFSTEVQDVSQEYCLHTRSKDYSIGLSGIHLLPGLLLLLFILFLFHLFMVSKLLLFSWVKKGNEYLPYNNIILRQSTKWTSIKFFYSTERDWVDFLSINWCKVIYEGNNFV